MLFSTKKIRNLVLASIAALWMVSIVSMAFSTKNTATCDPDCPMELVHKREITYQGLEKKVVMLSGFIGWLSHYYTSR